MLVSREVSFGAVEKRVEVGNALIDGLVDTAGVRQEIRRARPSLGSSLTTRVEAFLIPQNGLNARYPCPRLKIEKTLPTCWCERHRESVQTSSEPQTFHGWHCAVRQSAAQLPCPRHQLADIGASPWRARARLHFSSPGCSSRHGEGRCSYNWQLTDCPICPASAWQRGSGWLLPAMQASKGVTCSTALSGRPRSVASAQ